MTNLNEIRLSGESTCTELLPDFAIVEDISGKNPINIYSLALEQGEIHLSGEINSKMADHMNVLLRFLAREKMNIKIFIDSHGGEVNAGLAIYDLLDSYPYDVDIYAVGIAASMAAVLLAGGRKGHRYILPHSKVMIHEPLISGGFGGSATTIQKTAESILETKKKINEMLAKFTGKTLEEIDKATAFDNFLSADEAIEFGLCDEIATGF